MPSAILIMDDDEAVRDAMQRVLTRLGHPIVAVATAAEAVQACESGEPAIALVVADLSLAGAGFAGRLAGAQAVVYVSGLTRSAATRRGLLVDGDLLVSKPFTTAALRSAVATALANGSPEESR
ncbi:MAG TPA: response regulator [Micromonosporaceae bacterium]